MARTTRSNANQPSEKSVAVPPPKAKPAGKKRKRVSAIDPDELPASKQQRTAAAVKDEASPPPDDDQLPQLPLAADVPVHPDDARRILDVLEMCA